MTISNLRLNFTGDSIMSVPGLMEKIEADSDCYEAVTTEKEISVVIDGNNSIHSVYRNLTGEEPKNISKVFNKQCIEENLDCFFKSLKDKNITVKQIIVDGVGDFEKLYALWNRKK